MRMDTWLVADRTVTGPMGSFELIVTKVLELPKWNRDAPEYGETPRVDDQIQFPHAEPTSFSFALSNYIKDFSARCGPTGRRLASVYGL